MIREGVACRELVEYASDYLEGELLPALHRAIDRHLPQCPGCTAYLKQMRLTISALRRTAAVRPGGHGEGDRDRLVDLFRRWQEA